MTTDREALDGAIGDINQLVQAEQRWGRVEQALQAIRLSVDALTARVGEQNGRVTRVETLANTTEQNVHDHFQEIKYTMPYQRLKTLEDQMDLHLEVHKTRTDAREAKKEVRRGDVAVIGFFFGLVGMLAAPTIKIIVEVLSK